MIPASTNKWESRLMMGEFPCLRFSRTALLWSYPQLSPKLRTDLQAFPYLPLGLGLYMFIFKG